MNRHVKRRASDEITDIHVTGEFSRRHAAIASGFLARDSQRTGEWLQRNHNAGKKLGRHLVEVEIEVLYLAIGVDSRELAEHAGDVEVRSVGAGHDLVERHLQHIARLGPLDIDGTRQGMRTTAGKIRPGLFDLLDCSAWNNLIVAV